MDAYLHKLILEGEHQRLDFKVEISDAAKIARTLVAFSNTEGGRLLLGVKDGGGISGVQSEEEIFMLGNAAKKFCKPRVHFETRKWVVGKKTVVEVIILPGELRPYFALEADEKWVPYLRIKDQNIVADKILLKIWEKKKQPAGTLLKFSRVEKFLLNYLETQDNITLADFCLLTRVPRFIGEKIIINLVSMELLSMDIQEKDTFYSLNKERFVE